MTIVIDAGHGGYDPGAVLGNRLEKNDNLRLALLLRDKLLAAGQRVIMTRADDRYLTLQQRTQIANSNNADLFISLHRNSSAYPTANGIENYVYLSAPERTRQYAQNTIDELVKAGVQSNRGVKNGDYYVLRFTNAPAQLLEMGFISNAVDNQLFDSKLDAYATAIANGILKSLGQVIPPAQSTSQTIRNVQSTLNDLYGAGLTVDGIFGPRTKAALIRGLQIELNRNYNANLQVDGVFGQRTKGAIRPLRQGDRNNMVYIMQAMLYALGYYTHPDGIFGAQTAASVLSFQQANNLTPDSIAGQNTLERLFT